jgi:outer membrane lipopolysaccharide assembly protein LptE/RlpB
VAFSNSRILTAVLCAGLTGCGYHVAGHADMIPKTVKTIAIPRWANTTTKYKLTDHLPEAIAREFIARTRYKVVNDPEQADAVLTGAVVNFVAYPTIFDQTTGRASGLQIIVTMQLRLMERTTGKVLFTRPSFEARQRYEISIKAQAYFEESGEALERLSRDVARDVVSAILENF